MQAEATETVSRGMGRPFALPPVASLPEALLAITKRRGRKVEAVEDPERTPLTYDRLLLGALVLGRQLAMLAPRKGRVGLLLPNVNGLVVSLFGLWFHGRVPVLLNFTAGLKNLRSATRTAELRTIVTSRRFVDTAKLDDIVQGLSEQVEIVYLEDIRKAIGTKEKLIGLAMSFLAGPLAKQSVESADDPAVVLFTSGSEGEPKGVVLSHRNLIANAFQIAGYGDGFFTPDDVLFNPLPCFHSFGLTAGLLFPLLSGLKVVLYPSPLHFKQVPKLIGETRSTVLLATDTFLAGYVRAASEGDLERLRLVVAGAEKVKEATRALWAHLPAAIVEGYGCTECSPVLSCNHPLANMPGTVGPPLPGVEWALHSVPGIEEGGRLHVRGPNVMLGYMFASEPGRIQPQGEWHDTGDIVTISEEGGIIIRGRAKRFAKIGGEMVSLGSVEAVAAALWPDATHVAVSMPDAKKGEQVVLVTDQPDADRASFHAHARQDGISELFVPRAVLVVPSIPVLGSGKVDYVGTAELALAQRALI